LTVTLDLSLQQLLTAGCGRAHVEADRLAVAWHHAILVILCLLGAG
jgi:hypothetical protein